MTHFGDPTSDAEYQALHDLSRMMVGTKELVNQPGVLYSLGQMKATPADAQTIDQFMQGLSAQKRVQIARASGSGTYIKLSSDEKSMLSNMGVSYNDVEFTPQVQANLVDKQILDQSNGKATAKRNADGSLALDKHGQIQTQAVEQHHEDNGGFWGFLGDAWDGIKSVAWDDILHPVLSGMNKGLNLVEYQLSGGDDPSNPDPTTVDDMKALGYNPDSFWSTLAYQSSGKAHSNLKDLYNKYGQDNVLEAIKFANDPGAARRAIEQDDASYTTDAAGRSVLTLAAKAKLDHYNSKDFQDLARRVGAKTQNIGNDFASLVHLDPVDHPDWYATVAGATNLVSAFAIDPTLIALNIARGVKLSQVTIQGLGDGYGAATVLTRGGHYAKSVQRGWQQGFDLAAQMRAAHAAGDEAKLASLTAQFQATLPGLAPIMDDFVGINGVKNWDHAIVDGKSTIAPNRGVVYGGATGEVGLNSLEDAAIWVQRKWNLQMLSHGRAGTQSGLMPGALSRAGYRRFKGQMAGWMTTRSSERLAGHYDATLSRIDADPMLAKTWLDDGLIRDAQPQANDAVAFDGNSIAFKPENVSHALGHLIGVSREGHQDAVVEQALGSELDNLEARLQATMADKTADPAVIAGLHDDIQTGRDLLDMASQGAKLSVKEVSAAKVALKRAEGALNDDGVRGAGSIENGVADKAVAPGTSPLPSQLRSRYELTEAGKGEVQHNIRASGNPFVESGKIRKLNPVGVAERFRLAATRFTTLLPRNMVFRLDDELSGDKVYKFARTYLSRGEASLLRAGWNFGNSGQREVIMQGLIDQIGHAAGLGKTATGRSLLGRIKATEQSYASSGDGIVLDGQPVALSAGQTRMEWRLPSFQAFQQAAHKVGIYEATLGRAATASETDTLMAQWKMGALFKPSTVTRNQLEGWLRVMLDGTLGEALRARAFATARNGELWDRGIGLKPLDDYKALESTLSDLSDRLPTLTGEARRKMVKRIGEVKTTMAHTAGAPAVMHHLALRAGDKAQADLIRRGTLLSGETLGRSKFTARLLGELAPDTKKGVALAFAGVPLALAGRAYRSMMLRNMDHETLAALETMNPHDLAAFMEGYAQQVLEGTVGFANATSQSTAIANAGYGASQVRYALKHGIDRGRAAEAAKGEESRGWKHLPTDDTIGADRYSNHLHRLVDSQPESSVAVLDYIERKLAMVGDAEPEGGVSEITAALDNEAKHTAYGNVYFDDPVNAPGVARAAINDEERALGKEEWARQLVSEFDYLLRGRNGVYQHAVGQHIRETGEAPDGSWITANLKGDNRPLHVSAPDVMAMPAGGIRGFASTMLDAEGGAYQWFVERPLQRTTSSPVFLVHYAQARKSLNADVERMVTDLGVSREAAETFASESAVKQAWIKTEQLIDDPGQKTQFDVVARNLFPFARATNAMIRRWGSGLWQNPVAARKMMLAYEGAGHSGFTYDNSYGEPSFVYPVSGAFNMALRAFSELPFVGDLAYFPLSADMTGGTLLAVPGADNPFRFSAGPMVTMPLRTVYKHFLPQSWRGDFEKFDEAINGPIGVGEVWPQVLPTIARKFYVNMIASDRDSALASATNGAFANLAAAGLIPPPDASPSQVATFQRRLHAQVRSQLFLRFAFGLIAPAAPSKPDELTDAGRADFAWSLDGIRGLSDEYKSILNDTKGDIGHANAIFTAMHPDSLVYNDDGTVGSFKPTSSAYEVGGSKSTTPGGQLVSTEPALRWMETNADFIEKYRTVAAYFMPKASLGDPFSDAAYNMQIQLGLRQRKTPQEFMEDVYTRAAEAPYYEYADQLNAKIAQAKNVGDAVTAKQYADYKSQWETEYKAMNPWLAKKLQGYPEARKVASDQLQDLRQMVTDGAVPAGQRQLLSNLLASYDGYVTYIHTPGKTPAQKSAAFNIFNQWAKDNVTGTPISDVFNGVFRVLNTNLDTITGS